MFILKILLMIRLYSVMTFHSSPEYSSLLKRQNEFFGPVVSLWLAAPCPHPQVLSKTWQSRPAGCFLDGHVCLSRSQCPLPSATGMTASHWLALSINTQRQMVRSVDGGDQRPVSGPKAIPTLMERRGGWRHTMLMMP